MSKINKVSDGLLLKDDFNTSFNPEWDFFPNSYDRVLFDEDSIIISHKESEPLEMILSVPKSSSFVLQTEIEYNPVTVDDKAGCLIKSVTENIVKCEFFYEEDVINKYKFIKMDCNENSIVNLTASINSINWANLGNTKFFDGNYIGYYTDSKDADLKIKNFILYKSKYISILGISKNNEIKLLDSNGNNLISTKNLDILIQNNKAIIDISTLLCPVCNIKIVVNNTEIFINELYGGDIFYYDSELDFCIEEATIINGSFELGDVSTEGKNFTLNVTNNCETRKCGKIKVDQFSSYNIGYNMAYLYNYDETDFSFINKEIDIDINSGQTMKYILRIAKNDDYIYIDDNLKFNITFISSLN